MFYSSYKKAETESRNVCLYHTFKAVIFIVFIPIDYTILNAEVNYITSAMGIAIAVSLLSLIGELLFYFNVYGNVIEYLNLSFILKNNVD
jgi:hypothetical protein